VPKERVYLDHAATAPLGPAAKKTLLRALEQGRGNPSSPHLEGRAAKDALEAARSRAAAALGVRPREVIFTGGGTEALQIAVQGAARARREVSTRVVASAVEHPAVLEPLGALAKEGFELVTVPVGADGRVDPSAFLAAVEPGAALACLMLANHEMGAIMPVAEVARALAERRVPLLCDAALGPGRLPTTAADVGAPLIAFAAHKFGGPEGSGLLVVRRGTRLAAWQHGGLQEERLRPGTESVAAAEAAAAELERAVAETDERARRYGDLARRFLDGLAPIDGWRVVGPRADGLPGLVTVEVDGVEGEAAMINMDLEGFAISTGSTCALGSRDPSPGLLAMGLSRRAAASTLRISVGEGTTPDHVERAASTLCRVVTRLRALARGMLSPSSIPPANP
jgi:cysteine desulfurase